VKTEQRIVIKDWKTIVVQRMSFLLIASVIIFLFVIGLLYYSIKNLITQKKTSEVKTDFINNITHELKTPLATLSIATKSLKNETIITNKEAFSSTLNIVERQSNRLQKLIDQVLTNSLSSDAIVLSKETMSDNNYFSELIQDFILAHQHSDIEIINEVCAPEVMLRIDRFHFTTALNNILENAVKYGKENTRITVKTDCKNGNYHITIGDNGIGISEKDQEHIFDKFYRVGDGNVHDVKGLGLGLYYTSQIIGAHEGRIAIQSELGTGTTFHIKIPVN
jgi:signal transduction histidine kinase